MDVEMWKLRRVWLHGVLKYKSQEFIRGKHDQANGRHKIVLERKAFPSPRRCISVVCTRKDEIAVKDSHRCIFRIERRSALVYSANASLLKEKENIGALDDGTLACTQNAYPMTSRKQKKQRLIPAGVTTHDRCYSDRMAFMLSTI